MADPPSPEDLQIPEFEFDTLDFQLNDMMELLSSKETMTNKERDDTINHTIEVLSIVIREFMVIRRSLKRYDKFVSAALGTNFVQSFKKGHHKSPPSENYI